MRLALASLKGGTAKTTTAVFLAWLLSRSGRVLVVDADPQASLTRWSVRAGEAWTLPTIQLAVPDIHKRLPRLVADGDHVVIDTPPEREQVATVRSAVLAADLVLVTQAPTLIDLDRLAATLQLVNDVWNVHEPVIRALLVKTRAGTRARADARTALAEFGIPLLASEVPMLEAYAQSFGTVPPAGGHYDQVLAELLEAVA